MIRIVAVIIATVIVVYCVFGETPHPFRGGKLTDIGELTRNPDRYNGQTVMVKGTVVDATGIFGHGKYRVRQSDSGSEIVVVTSSGVPPSDTVVTVRGVVKQAFVIGSRQYAVIIQDDQLRAGT